MKKIILLISILGIAISCSGDLKPVEPEESIPDNIYFDAEMKKIYEELSEVTDYLHRAHPDSDQNELMFYGLREKRFWYAIYTFDMMEDNKQHTNIKQVAEWFSKDDYPVEKYLGYGETGSLTDIFISKYHKAGNSVFFGTLNRYNNIADNVFTSFIIDNGTQVLKKEYLLNKRERNATEQFFPGYFYVQYQDEQRKPWMDCFDFHGKLVDTYSGILAGADGSQGVYQPEYVLDGKFCTYHSFLKFNKENCILSCIELDGLQSQWTCKIKDRKDDEKCTLTYLKTEGDVWEIQLDSIFWDGTKEQHLYNLNIKEGKIVEKE